MSTRRCQIKTERRRGQRRKQYCQLCVLRTRTTNTARLQRKRKEKVQEEEEIGTGINITTTSTTTASCGGQQKITSTSSSISNSNNNRSNNSNRRRLVVLSSKAIIKASCLNSVMGLIPICVCVCHMCSSCPHMPISEIPLYLALLKRCLQNVRGDPSKPTT